MTRAIPSRLLFFKERQEQIAYGRPLRRAILSERVKSKRANSQSWKSEGTVFCAGAILRNTTTRARPHQHHQHQKLNMIFLPGNHAEKKCRFKKTILFKFLNGTVEKLHC